MNHYAFGCVSDWIYRRIGGMESHDAGYRHFTVRPVTDYRFTFAKRAFNSINGQIEVAWERTDERFQLHVTIPCNSNATIIMPNGDLYEVGSGQYDFSV